jgi:hypothetical protein
MAPSSSVRASRLPWSFRRSGVALAGLCLLAAACGGGGGGAAVTIQCTNAPPDSICLESCSLSCGEFGCARTLIAQNEILTFVFSEDIDPATVGPGTIRLRTSGGETPSGEYFVTGRKVEFVPAVSFAGPFVNHGFRTGETYLVTIPGRDDHPEVVRSAAGRPFGIQLACTVYSVLGIVDFNFAPPSAQLVSPTPAQQAACPPDVPIVLEFNEGIDTGAFQAGLPPPVLFDVRRAREGLGGASECNPAASWQALAGSLQVSYDVARRISVLTFQPAGALPTNACVQVRVTEALTDLSGRPAVPHSFFFYTQLQPLTQVTQVEEFDDAAHFDPTTSAGQWGGGVATFARIGGDGRHGAFSTAIATDTGMVLAGRRVYELSTEYTLISAVRTMTGQAAFVTDGRFFFTSMHVPSDVHLRIVGSVPAVITVAGRCEIEGLIDARGMDVTTVSAGSIAQPGAPGGPGGGAGGRGGAAITTVQATSAGATQSNQGGEGQDVSMPAGHAYASSAVGTGGRGSTVFPPSGLNTAVFFGALPGFSPGASAGGGGGGMVQPGGAGVVAMNNHADTGFAGTSTAATSSTVTIAFTTMTPDRYAGRAVTITAGVGEGQVRTIVGNTSTTLTVTPAWTTPPTTSSLTVAGGAPPLTSQLGPSAAGGSAVALFPFPASGGMPASLHFLIGGSGGGGAASCACLASSVPTFGSRFVGGNAGAGGGGAVALRAGGLLRVAASGRVTAEGGHAIDSTGEGQLGAPGGGGAGGSVVLQSSGTVELLGAIDVRGGTGGTFERFAGSGNGAPPAGARVEIRGGNGSPGFVRLETPTMPPLSHLAGAQPPAGAQNLGVLGERDPLVALTSTWYTTGQLLVPEYVRYEVHATVAGVPIVFSDDPGVGQAAIAGQAIRVLFQGAEILPGAAVPLRIGDWRAFVRSTAGAVGIDADSWANSYRFRIVADHGLALDTVVTKVVVVYRA